VKQTRGMWLLLFLACGLTLPAAAEMYKWTDENGVTIYSQSPPPGGEATVVKPPPPPPEPLPSTSPLEEPPAGDAKRAPPDPKEVARRQAEEEALRKLDCRAAQDRLRAMERGGSFRIREEDGTSRRLDPEERQRLLREAREDVKKSCP
jgi:hypothetical protein